MRPQRSRCPLHGLLRELRMHSQYLSAVVRRVALAQARRIRVCTTFRATAINCKRMNTLCVKKPLPKEKPLSRRLKSRITSTASMVVVDLAMMAWPVWNVDSVPSSCHLCWADCLISVITYPDQSRTCVGARIPYSEELAPDDSNPYLAFLCLGHACLLRFTSELFRQGV
jgi:hypothetical protein